MVFKMPLSSEPLADQTADTPHLCTECAQNDQLASAEAALLSIVTSSFGAPPATVGTLNQMAAYLTTGSWGGVTQFFDVTQNNVITVNLTSLTAPGAQLARWAIEAWELVANLDFQEVSGVADIQFQDTASGAWASFSTINDRIVQSTVNVSTNWLATSGTTLGSFSHLTYIHEIGHALGLGHLGAYNGGAAYPLNAVFSNDSYQYSVLSYFDQVENTTTNASYAIPVLPMLADIVAIQTFYGASVVTAGDTVWGANTTLTGFLVTLFNAWQAGGFGFGASVAMTVFDQSGIDLLDLSFSIWSDRIDLREEQFSDIGGLIGNLAIARGTVIEKLIAGSGDDFIIGNAAANEIWGSDGFDTISGGDGNDTITGGNGRDLIYLNQGNDLYIDNSEGGELGQDTVFAGFGDDIIQGGNGDDVFFGEWGADFIVGRLGNDLIYGGDQFDTLAGGDGDDTIDAGNGRDLVFLDAGNDLFIDNSQGGELGNDTVFAGSGDDIIQGGNGDDVFYGEAGNDIIFGRLGNDLIFAGDNFDFVDAGDGNDVVFAGNGRDMVFLGAGDDIYVDAAQAGELGQDTISGGAGADRFEFQSVMSADVITDFQIGIDDLRLTQSLWGGGLTAAQVVSSFASVTGSGVLLDFGGGQSILLQGLTKTAGLEADILLA
jgi:serralysin